MDKPKYNLEQEVVFKEAGQPLKMVIQPPLTQKYAKAPVLYLITGGGFWVGDRYSMLGFMASELENIRKDGFLVASIDYRLNGSSVSMSQTLSDCMDGIRYLVKYQDELAIDVDNISVCGHSAGGYLTLGVGVLDQNLFYKDSPYKEISYKLKSISALAPVISYHDIEDTTFLFDKVCLDAENAMVDREEKGFDTENLCPYANLKPTTTKTLIVHGNGDTLVNYKASEVYCKKAKEIGADITFLISDNGAHDFSSADGINHPSHDLAEVCKIVHRFIK